MSTALALLLLAIPALAQGADPPFPPLGGRVVDAANILTPDARAALEAKLKAEEEKTSDQVVVATVPSLSGLEIEDYANRLFRAWKLGQAKTNNGVLLLVAPKERKVRIEVGYGLEGTLTDAISGVVIRSAIAPRFKAGDYPGGIAAGVDAVIAILNGDAAEWQDRARQRPAAAPQTLSDETIWAIFAFVVLSLIIIRLIVGRFSGAGTRYHRRRDGTWVAIPTSGGGWSGGGWSGGGGSSSSGGFSGGGGSSGGGGASGSW